MLVELIMLIGGLTVFVKMRGREPRERRKGEVSLLWFDALAFARSVTNFMRDRMSRTSRFLVFECEQN